MTLALTVHLGEKTLVIRILEAKTRLQNLESLLKVDNLSLTNFHVAKTQLQSAISIINTRIIV